MQRNVVCLKWGTMYGPEYVNKLYGMVRRNLDGPFRFVCFTDDANGLRSEVEVRPLPNFPEPPWEYARYCSAWRKLALFDSAQTSLRGRTLFLDLDLVVLRSMDAFFVDDAPFKMLENWYQKGKGQASVMRFDDDYAKPVLDAYLRDPLAILERFQTEQAYISDALCKDAQAYFGPELCLSYKKHVMHHGLKRFSKTPYSIPEQASLLVFHGRPNPPHAIDGDWGKKMLRIKQWWKGLKPCPWIAEYWVE